MRKISTLILSVSVLCSPSWGMRIVSLLPSNTEILDSLGARADVVGVTRFDRLAGSPGVEGIGDFMQPNIEKIVSLKPDLIVAGLWSSSHTVPRLKAMGYPVIEIRNPDSLDQLYDSVRLLAKAAGREPAADPLVRDMRRRWSGIEARAKALPRRLRTYVEIDRPYWTIGGNDFLSEAFKRAGADNIFSDLKRQAAQVSPEIIIERSPDLIVSFAASRSEIAKRSGWVGVKALRSGYVIDDISADDLSRPSPRLLDGIEKLIQRIESLESK